MQSNIEFEKFSESSPQPVIVGGGKVREFDGQQFSGKYLVVVVIRAAWDSDSTEDLLSYSNLAKEFQNLGCNILAISRDGPAILLDFLQENPDIALPIISDLNLSKMDIGIIQRLGITLTDGYPVPTAVAMDKNGVIRYISSQSAAGTSAPELLRVIRALHAVDDGKGSKLCPADWDPSKPLIVNDKEGIDGFYRQMFKEEKVSNEPSEEDPSPATTSHQTKSSWFDWIKPRQKEKDPPSNS